MIMWLVKVIEGKDQAKLPNDWFAFLMWWEEKGYKNMAELLLEMAEQIHQSGKVMMGDSGFCVAVGIMALHQDRVYGQLLIKKMWYWPKGVLGDYLYHHMNGKQLGEMETHM